MLLRAQGPLTGNSITFLFRVSWWSCANTLRNNVTSRGTMCELLDYYDLLDMNFLHLPFTYREFLIICSCALMPCAFFFF